MKINLQDFQSSMEKKRVFREKNRIKRVFE